LRIAYLSLSRSQSEYQAEQIFNQHFQVFGIN